jgi:hypothetical protein
LQVLCAVELGSQDRENRNPSLRRIDVAHVLRLKFLRLIDRKTPKGLALQLMADNYATPSYPEVQAWPVRHPRLVMHFTRSGASWLNMVSGPPGHRDRACLSCMRDATRNG